MKAYRRFNASGQSMIELALMLPFLFIFLLAIFEWGQIFIKHIRVSTLCREAAIAASQDCKNINTVTTGETKQQCVNRIQQEMTTKASYSLTDFQNRGFIIVALHGASEVSSPPSSGFASRYSGTMDPDVQSALGTVAMCEFFYDNAIVTPIEYLFSFVMPRMIYKTTYA